ncbi:axonemal dynein light chain domain-containing protein 1 isoform X2 [Archocentrus centrarchus]|uniref:axonemal dynein light chain domain-containing protein 1 isoform X2 n=1 Tax=Archocentrus centrarchus TaxID=63155 RepID=UPI0011EA29FE|nr:axonemal dynein light chain domain-containing protein 1-like isoform X2 [Archocentrus centrarchus]
MSASARASSAPHSSRPEQPLDTRVAELNFQVPVESIKTQPPDRNQIVPHELLLSLTSTVCKRRTLGQSAHDRHCEGCGIRRPDAVWHHPLGRKKYKYFLEQPTSLTGAGSDISFLCDAVVTKKKTTPLPPVTEKSGVDDTENLCVSDRFIPEEYHIVKNKGIRSLEFYEDAFTVQLKDDEQRLRVLPSLRPSGRLEVVQLMKMMDDMLEKAGVDEQNEELTEVSQLEGLLELVKVEQNIYNIVFHELIRQVSVGCAERGQLLAKLRQRYQSLLDRIPRRLKALHTEVVAQRALDRRLTEEIHHIKSSIQQLSTELSKIRDHDAFVSQQAEHAHWQLAEALKQTHINSNVVQAYHELYELQRARLEAQLIHMTEDRDCWAQFTLCLALKVISVKKLHLVSHLHICEQNWFKTAEHCILFLTSKDTECLNIIMDNTDCWKKQLTAFMSQLKKTEHAHCAQISAIQQGINNWLSFCSSIKKHPDPKYNKTSVEEIHADLKQWSNMLALQCEHHQGEKQLSCQQTLSELGRIQEKWLNMSLQLFRRHPAADGVPLQGQQAQRELDKILSELLKELDIKVNGENGFHGHLMSLCSLMESWVSKLAAVIEQPEQMSVSDWLELEKALHNWQSLTEEAQQHFSNKKDNNKPDIFAEAEKEFDSVQEFMTNLSNLIEGENFRLHEEIRSVHMAQTRWMLDLLLFVVPNHSEEQNHEQELHQYIPEISQETLDEDAKMLTEKLDHLSSYITSSCTLVLEEQVHMNTLSAQAENEMNEFKRLQKECGDWVETCMILLTRVHGAPEELPVRPLSSISNSDVLVCRADSMETLVNKEVSAESTTDNEDKEVKADAEPKQRDGELAVCESPVLNLISYDGSITQRKLGACSVHLHRTGELVVSPVTEDNQKAFRDLTTVGLLQQELHDSEVRVKIAEERALKAEEALQEALKTIKDLERQQQCRPSLQPRSNEGKKKPPPSPSPPPETTATPPKKSPTTAKPTSSTKKTKKR